MASLGGHGPRLFAQTRRRRAHTRWALVAAGDRARADVRRPARRVCDSLLAARARARPWRPPCHASAAGTPDSVNGLRRRVGQQPRACALSSRCRGSYRRLIPEGQTDGHIGCRACDHTQGAHACISGISEGFEHIHLASEVRIRASAAAARYRAIVGARATEIRVRNPRAPRHAARSCPTAARYFATALACISAAHGVRRMIMSSWSPRTRPFRAPFARARFYLCIPCTSVIAGGAVRDILPHHAPRPASATSLLPQ